MIQLVHAHPHQVTFVCGGPLTNIALAIRIDPEFSRLARRLVLAMSARDALEGRPPSGKPNFNEIFDPEAAHIALTAGWDELVVIDTVAPEPPLTADIVSRIQEHPTAASNYLVLNGKLGLPIWGMHVAIVADPSLVLSEGRMASRLDVELDERRRELGSSVIASPDTYCGPPGGQVVTWVRQINLGRYVDDYVAALQSPKFRPMPPEFADGIYPRKER